MFYKEINSIIRSIGNDQIIRVIAGSIVFLSILIAVVFSSVAALIILISYIAGIIVCWSVLRYQKKASAYLQRLASFYKGHISPRKDASESCAVCSNVACNRHESSAIKHPWKKLYINKKLNTAVEHFYNRIIDTFVLAWYKNITKDTSFGNELQYGLRYATATAVNKILELETGVVITNKLVPCAIRHIDDFFCMQQIAKIKNEHIDKVAVEYLGRRLHVAATSRSNEISYIKHLTDCLLPQLLPADYLKCSNISVLIRELFTNWVLLPLMDVLADPNIINSLVILVTTYKHKGSSRIFGHEEKVEFLCNFVHKETKNSLLGVDLKTVIKTPPLLYAFMQFLKKEGYVHLLLFCMDVEEFNNKLITPDLSKRQLENLHIDALNLYKVYLNSKSADFVGCPNDIIAKLHALLQEGVYNVAKLRTSEPLFQAFDYAFGVLENEWLPQFYHSNEFYSNVYGTKISTSYTKAATRSRKLYESYSQGTVAKISSGFGKIKGALKTAQPVDGALYPHESNIEVEGTSLCDDITSEIAKIVRDLSSWRITVPTYNIHQITPSKLVHFFNVNVEKIDMKSWTVPRKDQDFHTLKAKLVEFHGENEFTDCILPSRRSTATTEHRKVIYEDFLRKLLLKPALKGSDLLYMFFTAEQDFTITMATAAVPIGDLGNIYQSVAHKLRKEKGQHLDSFMHTFLASTGKPKQNKFEWAEQVDERESSDVKKKRSAPKILKTNVFKDNYGVPFKTTAEGSSSGFFNPNGITESLFYLLKHTFNVPRQLLKLYAAFCSISQQALESFSRYYIERKLTSGLSERNLAYLIGLLEDVLFEKYKAPTKEELETRKSHAFKEIDNSVPAYMNKILGSDFKNGLSKLLEILQNPCYNKQLAYNLLDIIIAEMYPQFDSCDMQNK